MLLFAEGLFRLDLVVGPDTLRTVVRNLSGDEIEPTGGSSGYGEATYVLGEAASYEPVQSRLEFALGSGNDRVAVKVLIATMRFRERGTVRVTTQAVIRQAPVS
jgi:hypothetical protein